MSLGHETTLADLVYLWAIQYYADYERVDRKRYVEHVFANVITELDPHYVDAYWIGALILILEAGDFDAGIALLEKGATYNPDDWILLYLAGWECYHARQYDRAVAFFERAAVRPGAPTSVRRTRAGLLSRSGDLRQAIALWQGILDDPSSDARSRRIAERKLRELRTRIGLQQLQAALRMFRRDNGRWPTNLDELVDRSYLERLPRDPDDHAFVYDSRTGKVSSTAGRVLGGG
jgi:tetratricopeptide (TPR) repeat protein